MKYALAALFLTPALALADGVYLRLDAGVADSHSARYSDANCANSAPPALFGCGAGRDGAPLAAVGDFSSARNVEVGVGYRWSPNWRTDLTLGRQSGYSFAGNANFLNTTGAQDVRNDVTVQSVFLNAYFDLPLGGALTPYFGIGAGWAEKDASALRYTFPGISATAATTTPGGKHSDAVWRATLGAALALAPRLSLDVALWYADFGKVESPAGSATIVRASGTRVIAIDATSATLRAQGLNVGLRYAF